MSSCGSNSHPLPSKPLPLIKVNDVVIDETIFANELQYHKHDDFNKVVQLAGQALVVRQLLLEQTNKEGLELTPEQEEDALEKLLQKSISYDDPSEDDCIRYFESNPEKFKTMPLMEVDHILLAASKEDMEGRDDAKSQALEVLKKLENNPETFAVLAEQYSACPSKKMGGSLGQISNGQTVPEFERQLMLMPEGLVKNPIESRYGYHVVNVHRKIEGKAIEYRLMADKVRGYLVHRASHQGIQAYIQGLVENAKIEGIELQFTEENVQI